MTNNDRQTGSGAATSDDIVRLYRDLLGREPESPVVVEERVGRPLLDVATDIGLSEEFSGRVRALSAGATAEEVARLYNLLLERNPESETAISEKAGRPIIEIVAEIANSEEFSKLRVTQAQIAAETAELHQLLLPDAPIDALTLEEIARVARVHHVRLPTIAWHMAAMDCAKRAAERGERFSGLGWTEPLSGDFRQSETFGDQVELVIPTVNSERWLGCFLEFYKANRIRGVYAVDRRTSDGTRGLITKYGFPFIEVEAAEPRIEALLPSIAAQIAAPWILRLDDDELPTPNLLEFAANVAASDSIAAHSFPRANYRCNPASGRLERSYFFAFGPDAQLFRACRLYKPKSVTYYDELHTSGFFPLIEKFAAPDIYILHFDWVLRSRQARQAKFESYERQSAVVARKCKHHCLYETVPEAWHLFGEVQDVTLQNFARNLHHIL